MVLPKSEVADHCMDLATRFSKFKADVKEQAAVVAEEGKLFGAAAAGGGAAGYIMGSIQQEIDAGTEGYTEESTSLFGVLPYDIALAAGVGGLAYSKYGRKYRSELRSFAVGAVGFAAGRMAYEYARTPDEEEEDAA